MKTFHDKLRLRPRKYAGRTVTGHVRCSSGPYPVAANIAEALDLPVGDAICVHIEIPGADNETGYAILYACGECADWLEAHAAQACETQTLYRVRAKSIWGISYDQVFTDLDQYMIPDTNTGFLLLECPVPVTEHT